MSFIVVKKKIWYFSFFRKFTYVTLIVLPVAIVTYVWGGHCSNLQHEYFSQNRKVVEEARKLGIRLPASPVPEDVVQCKRYAYLAGNDIGVAPIIPILFFLGIVIDIFTRKRRGSGRVLDFGVWIGIYLLIQVIHYTYSYIMNT